MVITKNRVNILRIAIMAMALCLVMMFSGVMKSYAGSGTEEVFLLVDQEFTIDGSTATVSSVFDYELTRPNATNPLPAGAVGNTYSFSITGTSDLTLPMIDFTSFPEGIYRYTLECDSSAAATGYTYDPEVYDIEIHIYLSGGNRFSETIVYKNSGDKVNDIKFSQLYKPIATSPLLMVDPPVRKTVTGIASSTGAFTFVLKADNISNPMPAGSSGGIKQMVIYGSGTEDFGTWAYTSDGVYVYTIYEVNSGGTYVYDNVVYTITDTVTDVSGTLVLSRVVTRGTTTMVTDMDFVNQYVPPSFGGSTILPKTGDSVNNLPYQFALSGFITIAMLCVVFIIVSRRKERRENSEG